MHAQVVPAIIAGVGVVLLILTVVLGWIVVPNIIDDQIVEQVRLVNGSETWEKWQEIPIPIYLKFYIYNVTNGDAIEQTGVIPEIQEVGPYSYKQTRVKVNISQQPGGDDLLKYEEVKTYFWDKATSCETCSEDDTVNIINIAFVSVIAGVSEISPALAIIIANGVLGTERFIQRNVRVGDLTFKGFDVRLYTETLGPLLPEEFDGGRFGLYKGQNMTSDGEYEIYTGVGRTADFGKIKTWKGQTRVDEWWVPGSPCAMINGTDGSVFPPFVEKSWVMDIFNVDLCRSLYLLYEKEVEHKGIKGYRFTAPKRMLEDPRTNPANQCFCLEENLEDCARSGLLPVKKCRGGAPILMSTPHFLDGYDGYLNQSGLSNPEKEKHETFIDLEPHTAVALSASKRIQVNVEVKKMAGIKAMENIQNYTVFPLLWADENAALDDANADDLKKQLLTPLKIVDISKWTLLGVSCLILGIGIAFAIMRHRSRTQTV